MSVRSRDNYGPGPGSLTIRDALKLHRRAQTVTDSTFLLTYTLLLGSLSSGPDLFLIENNSTHMENAGHGLADSITLFRSKLAVYKCNPSPGKDRRPAPQEPHSNHTSQASTKSDTAPILQEPVTCTSNAGPDPANPRKRSRRGTDTSQETDRKSKKPKRGYAPPETYEHLHMLPDYLDQYLDGTSSFRNTFPPCADYTKLCFAESSKA